MEISIELRIIGQILIFKKTYFSILTSMSVLLGSNLRKKLTISKTFYLIPSPVFDDQFVVQNV